MKKSNIYIIILLLFGCKNDAKSGVNQKEISNKTSHPKTHSDAVTMLKEFYTVFYGTDKSINDENLLKKYITTNLADKINSMTSDSENLLLDYDPFLQGQDYDSKTLMKSLEIVSLRGREEFQVSFKLFPDAKKQL